MGNVTLIRPDGSKIVVPAEDADKLRTLQYRDQTPREEMEEGISRGIEKYYTSPEQKAITLGQGFASGLTLGLSDIRAKDADRERAKYNAGYRIGGEFLGGLVGLHPLASGTPVGLLTKGAGLAAEATGLGKVGQAVVRSGIEGAGYGGAAALTNAQLAGDPVTAEAIGAGMGWGALFAGGLGALGAGLEAKFEARAGKKLADAERKAAGIGAEEMNTLDRRVGDARAHAAVMEGMKERYAKVAKMEAEGFSRVSSTAHDVADELGRVVNTAKKMGDDVAEMSFNQIKNSQLAIKSQLTENYLMKDAKKYFSKAQVDLAIAQSAAKEGKFERMMSKMESFKESMVGMETALGGPKFFSAEKAVGQANDLIGLARYRMENAVKAGEELVMMSSLHSQLKGFPRTADEFVRMTPQRMEKLSAAIDGVGKLKAAELDGIKEAVKDAVTHLSDQLGVKMDGSPGAQLQGMWKALKDGRSSRAAELAKMGQEGNLLWKKTGRAQEALEQAKMSGGEVSASSKRGMPKEMQSFLKYQAGKAAGQKLGSAGYLLGAGLVSGLVSMKSAILGTIVDHAEKWVPKAARGLQKYGSKAEPLARRIDGNPDDDSKSRQEMMAARSKELREAAPGVRDTLYKSLTPLVTEHPELAAEMHAQQVKRFQFILSKMPKDPGLAYSNLRSLWKPDAVATEKFARYYEVFHDPVGVMVRTLKTGKITLEAAEGLREMNPELWQTLRVHMLERISQPEVAKRMKYEDQVHIGMLLGINLHSTMNPHFISAQQQMYTERNQPLEMNPRITPGGGAGRPSGPGPNATSAQRISEH